MLRKLEKRMKRANEKYGNATKPFLENLLLEEWGLRELGVEPDQTTTIQTLVDEFGMYGGD